MVLKILIILSLVHYSITKEHYECSQKSVLLLLKRPAYDFSLNVLERVAQDNGAHFGFSPLLTWLQLNALAEGARGRTLRELRAFTKHHRRVCFKQKFAKIMNKMTRDLKPKYGRQSVIIADEFFPVNKNYKNAVRRFYNVKVLQKNFDFMDETADAVNEIISKGTKGVIKEPLYSSDFNKTVMVISDNVFLNSSWRYPFNAVYTKQEKFTNVIGEGLVNMMSLTNYFNYTELPYINAKVLEIPCVGNFSMLIFMPLTDYWVGDIFYNLKRITLSAIYNRFKAEGEKLVTVKLPRFRINSTVDNLPELLYDMGIRRIFRPGLSELYISSYETMYASMMVQDSDVEITEKGITANASVDFLVNETSDSIEFAANKPFAYLLVDRNTQFILFGGAYSVPSLY